MESDESFNALPKLSIDSKEIHMSSKNNKGFIDSKE